MNINGYSLTVEQVRQGQWRSLLNGKTVAVVSSKRAAILNGEYLAKHMPAKMLAALTA